MGFFSKIFGGKKDTDEPGTQEPEKQEAKPGRQDRVSEPEPLIEEDQVPEPEPKSESEKKSEKKSEKIKDDNKSTVFGMPTPAFTPPAGQAAPDVTSGAVVSGELPVASGEISMGEVEIGSSGGADRAEAAGSMEIGGEDTLGATNSGEIDLGEVSVAAPVVRHVEPEPEAAEAPDAPEAAATPAAAASATDSGRLSGARPALLDEDDHSDVDLFPKADKKDLRSSIDCGSCRHKLPVPYVGYPARITCPFCLNVNEYNM